MNLQEVLHVITQTTFPLDDLTPLNFHIPTQFGNFTETIALLLRATNFCIWQTRLRRLNTELQNLKPVNHKLILAKIFNYISIREKKEKKLNDSIYVDTINTIKQTMAKILQNPIQIEKKTGQHENLNTDIVFCCFFLCAICYFLRNSMIWPCLFQIST